MDQRDERRDLTQVNTTLSSPQLLSGPIDARLSGRFRSLANNQLCGRQQTSAALAKGTYTAEGIITLYDGLKGSAVSSLKCAAAAPAPYLRALNFL